MSATQLKLEESNEKINELEHGIKLEKGNASHFKVSLHEHLGRIFDSMSALHRMTTPSREEYELCSNVMPRPTKRRSIS